MSRSAKKGPYVDEKLFKKITRLNENKAKQPIKTWARACTIIPEFVGHTFEVHNGNKFLKVFVQPVIGEVCPLQDARGLGSAFVAHRDEDVEVGLQRAAGLLRLNQRVHSL